MAIYWLRGKGRERGSRLCVSSDSILNRIQAKRQSSVQCDTVRFVFLLVTFFNSWSLFSKAVAFSFFFCALYTREADHVIGMAVIILVAKNDEGVVVPVSGKSKYGLTCLS